MESIIKSDTWSHSKSKLIIASHTWVIDNFAYLDNDTTSFECDSFKSSIGTSLSFSLELHQNFEGDDEDEDEEEGEKEKEKDSGKCYIGAFLVLLTSDQELTLNFEFSLLGADGSKLFSKGL